MNGGWLHEILRDFEGGVALAMIVARLRAVEMFPHREREIHMVSKGVYHALASILWIVKNWKIAFALLMLAAILLLSGCAVNPGAHAWVHHQNGLGNSSPGYGPWVQPQYELDEVTIRWIRTSDQDWSDFARNTGLMANGMAIPDPSSRSCIILANPPKRDGDAAMHILGHEVVHCFMGLWHGPWYLGDVDDVELGRVLSADENIDTERLLARLRDVMPRHTKNLYLVDVAVHE